MSERCPEPQARLFSADKPISTGEQDRLGRKNFAASIAKAVSAWHGDDSLVIGICGPWGSGKSSLKNLVREAVTSGASDGTAPIAVEFNAWEFSGQDQLSEAFFSELGEALGAATPSDRGKKLERGFKSLGQKLRFVSGISGAVRTLVGSVAPALAVTGAMPPEAVGAAAALALAADQVHVRTRELADATAQATERPAGPAKSVHELKAEIANLLRAGGRNVVVFLDDVDRLTASEIRLLFRLLKVNADLPRLVYVVLFQRDIVEGALGLDAVGTGRDFLAKIVQVSFDLPTSTSGQVLKILVEGLNEIYADERISRGFRPDEWQLLLPRITPYFRTLRDVRRFLSTLRFQVGLFLSDTSFEVNWIDLIGMEVLRTFEPDVYAALPAYKSVSGQRHWTYVSRHGAWEKELERTLQEILIGVPDGKRRENASALVKVLFPLLEGKQPTDEWERRLRVCSEKLFDTYLGLEVPVGEISKARLDRVMRLMPDRNALTEEFRLLHAEGLLEPLIERLPAVEKGIDLADAESFIAALFDIGDELSAQMVVMGVDSARQAEGVIIRLLQREPDESRREEVLERAIRGSSGLALPEAIVNGERLRWERATGKDASPGYIHLIRSEKVDDFKRLWLEKIVAAAQSGDLAKNPRLGPMLQMWTFWGDAEVARNWAKALVESPSPSGVFALLRSFIQRGYSEGRTVRQHDYIHPKALEPVIDLELIEQRLAAVDLDTVSDEDRRVANLLSRTRELKHSGRFDPFDDRDD